MGEMGSQEPRALETADFAECAEKRCPFAPWWLRDFRPGRLGILYRG
jgi:hypothetical protein